MLPYKLSFQLRVAFEAQFIEGLILQAAFFFTVRIVAV